MKNINTSIDLIIAQENSLSSFGYGNSKISEHFPIQNNIAQTTEWLELEFMFGLILMVCLLIFFFNKPIVTFIENSRKKTYEDKCANDPFSDRLEIEEIDTRYTSPDSIFSWFKHKQVKYIFVYKFVLLFTIMSYKEMLGIVEHPLLFTSNSCFCSF